MWAVLFYTPSIMNTTEREACVTENSGNIERECLAIFPDLVSEAAAMPLGCGITRTFEHCVNTTTIYAEFMGRSAPFKGWCVTRTRYPNKMPQRFLNLNICHKCDDIAKFAIDGLPGRGYLTQPRCHGINLPTTWPDTAMKSCQDQSWKAHLQGLWMPERQVLLLTKISCFLLTMNAGVALLFLEVAVFP